MTPLRILLAASLLFALPAFADELSVEKVAELQAEQEKIRKSISKKYGDRPSSELTNEERGQQIKEEQAAMRALFEKHGVTDKELAIRELRMDREEREAVKDARAALAAREEAKKAEEAQPPPGSSEPEIIRGTSEESPIEVYRDTEAIQVERPNEDGIIEQPSEETSIIPEGEITR